METALAFYCHKLGFSVFDDTLLEGPIVRMISGGCYSTVRLVLVKSSPTGAMIELQEFQPSSALTENAHSHPLRKGWVSILVPDLQFHIETMRMHDVHPKSELFVVKLPRSRACEAVVYQDPDGNDLEFLQIQR